MTSTMTHKHEEKNNNNSKGSTQHFKNIVTFLNMC